MTFQMEDVTADTARAAIQGPKVIDIVGTFSREIPTLKRYRFAEKSLMIAKLTVSRTGYTGEDGFEFFCPAAHARRFANSACVGTGPPLGLPYHPRRDCLGHQPSGARQPAVFPPS